MVVRYTDTEIEEMISEPKTLPQDFSTLPKMNSKRGHKEKQYNLEGAKGNKYRLILRQSDTNALDFSVILDLIPSGSNQSFTLRRYNGKHGEHTNSIERESFYDFHIHKATERYQDLGADEETYAEVTDRYSDFYTALHCMLKDCGFVKLDDDQQKLF